MRSALSICFITLFATGSMAAVDQLEEKAGMPLTETLVPRAPWPEPVNPVTPGTVIAEYAAFETYTFKSDAEEAIEPRMSLLRAAGIQTLGGRVVKKENRYSFVIEYLPQVKHGENIPPAVIMERYDSPSAYWLEREAEAAGTAAKAAMSAGGLSPLGVAIYKSGKDYAFRVDYAVKDLMRRTPFYDVAIKSFESGDYTFESDAEEAAPGLMSGMKRAGLAPISAVPLRKADRRWTLRAEHAVRLNKGPARPSHSIARYEPGETFTFDSGALEAGRETAAKFDAAGVKAVNHWARKINRDYAFGLDFIIRNIYQGFTVVPSAKVLTYSSPETFTFESEAKTALAEKAERFNAEGLPVVGGRTVEAGRDHSYSLDYLSLAR